MAGEGEEEIPPRYWYEFLDRFSRRDELLVAVLKDIRKLLGKVVEVPAVEVPEVEVPEFEVPELTAPQLKLIDSMAMRLQQLPNRLHKADIDTSQTSWRSLKGAGKLKGDVMQGFYIEAVGGGFSYKIIRGPWEAPEMDAEVDDSWDIEFDDLAVLGAGPAGTATVWYWWRATPSIRERIRMVRERLGR